MSCSVDGPWKNGDENVFNKVNVQEDCHKKYNSSDSNTSEVDECNSDHLHCHEYNDVKCRNKKNMDTKSRKNNQNNDRKSWQIMYGGKHREEIGGSQYLTRDQHCEVKVESVVSIFNSQPVKHSSPVDQNCTVHGYACHNHIVRDTAHPVAPFNESRDCSEEYSASSSTSERVLACSSDEDVPFHKNNSVQVSNVPVTFKTVPTSTITAQSCMSSPCLASTVQPFLPSASAVSNGVKLTKPTSVSSILVVSVPCASSITASNPQATETRNSSALANRSTAKPSTSSAKKCADVRSLASAGRSTGIRPCSTSTVNRPTALTRSSSIPSTTQSTTTCPRDVSHGQRLGSSESVIDPDDDGTARTACRLSRGEADCPSAQEKNIAACCSAGPELHHCHGALSSLAVRPQNTTTADHAIKTNPTQNRVNNNNSSMLNSRKVNRLKNYSSTNDDAIGVKLNLQGDCDDGKEGAVIKLITGKKSINFSVPARELRNPVMRNYSCDGVAVRETCFEKHGPLSEEQTDCSQAPSLNINLTPEERPVNVGDIVRSFEKNASSGYATKMTSKESPSINVNDQNGSNRSKGKSLVLKNCDGLVETHRVFRKARNFTTPLPINNSSVKVSTILAGSSKTLPFVRSGISNTRVTFGSELKRKSIAATGSLRKCIGTPNKSADNTSTFHRCEQNVTRSIKGEFRNVEENAHTVEVYVNKNNDVARLSNSALCRGDTKVHGHHCSVPSANLATPYSGNAPHEIDTLHSFEATSKVKYWGPGTMSLKRRGKTCSPSGDGNGLPSAEGSSKEKSINSVRGTIPKNSNTYPVVRTRCRQVYNAVTTEQPKAGTPSILEKTANERNSFNQCVDYRKVNSSIASLTPEDSSRSPVSPQEGSCSGDVPEHSSVKYYHRSDVDFMVHTSRDDTSPHDCRECDCDFDGVVHHDWQSEASSTCTERWNSRSNSSDYEEIEDFDGDSTGWTSSAHTEEGITCLHDDAHQTLNEDYLSSSNNKFEGAGGGSDGDCGVSGGRRIWACCGGGGVMPGGGGGGVVGGAYGGPRTNVFMDEDSPTVGRRSTGGFSETSGLVGLRNIGNTCFMNSVVQCLSNTRCLLEYLVKEGYAGDINTSLSTMKGDLIRAFGNLISEMWTEGDSNRALNTGPFKTQIQKFAPTFTGYQQHDAQEFLRKLLEGLHEDVNRVTVRPRPIHTDIDDNLDDDQKAMESWKRYLRFDDSKIVDMFVGQLKSSLQCSYCSHTSVTFDPFWDLSLPIPSKSGNVRLNQCLDLFTKEEVMDGDERPTCSKCKERRKMTKSFSIQKFPKVLVLHLKRFSPTERWRGKLSCTVEFPVEGLDLSKYASNSRSSSLYNLIGVANHSGTTYSGHYTAFCRHPYSMQWHEYNDSRVTPMPSRRVCSPETYVLFFELCSASKL